ncbi:hypothetical protein [Clostridium sp. chh4-2]|nr:hypothetical protein [Clostridium sp. chh4-2]
MKILFLTRPGKCAHGKKDETGKGTPSHLFPCAYFVSVQPSDACAGSG